MSLKDSAIKAKIVLLDVGTIATGLAAIGTIIFLYYSNVWKPSVSLSNVDFSSGIAELVVNGNNVTLYENEKYACGWGWDVEFGTDFTNNVQRVQLVRNNAVYQVLSIK